MEVTTGSSSVMLIAILVGGCCVLGVVGAGVAAVVLFMRRGQDDREDGASKSLTVLAVIGVVVLIGVGVLCVGGFVASHYFMVSPSPAVQIQQATPVAAPDSGQSGDAPASQ